jgi:hypothetical protein
MDKLAVPGTGWDGALAGIGEIAPEFSGFAVKLERGLCVMAQHGDCFIFVQ